MDLIDCADCNNISGAIVLRDIEKAFDGVDHVFLLEVLKSFNFGENFIKWVKVFYNNRKSYVINNGYFTDVIDMQNGIFQGCPISPYLFLCVIEVAALAIRQNEDIYGIFVDDCRT